MATTFDLASLPIALPLDRVRGEPDHAVLQRALCAGAEGLLRLPAGLAVDAAANYATTACCGLGSDAPAVSIRMRVLGIRPGKNAKKKFEYLGVSFVGLDAAGRVVLWSEDLFAFTDGGPSARDYWAAVDAGRELPPKAKRRAADCALLSFVTVKDGVRTYTPINGELHALVAGALASHG
ncbi:MAG: hypothetical protein U0325_06115 [Polyangiales bacterium]